MPSCSQGDPARQKWYHHQRVSIAKNLKGTFSQRYKIQRYPFSRPMRLFFSSKTHAIEFNRMGKSSRRVHCYGKYNIEVRSRGWPSRVIIKRGMDARRMINANLMAYGFGDASHGRRNYTTPTTRQHQFIQLSVTLNCPTFSRT